MGLLLRRVQRNSKDKPIKRKDISRKKSLIKPRPNLSTFSRKRIGEKVIVTKRNPLRVVFLCETGQGSSIAMGADFFSLASKSRDWFNITPAGLWAKETHNFIKNAEVIVSIVPVNEINHLLKNSKISSKPLWVIQTTESKQGVREVYDYLLKRLSFQ